MSSGRSGNSSSTIFRIRQRREEMREESLMERRDRLDRELRRDIENHQAILHRQEIERVQREQAEAMQRGEQASQAMNREAYEESLRRYIQDRERNHQYMRNAQNAQWVDARRGLAGLGYASGGAGGAGYYNVSADSSSMTYAVAIQGERDQAHYPWDRQVIRTKMNLSVSLVDALPERGYVNEIVSFEKKLYVYDGHAWNCITKNDSVEPEEIKGRKIVVGE